MLKNRFGKKSKLREPVEKDRKATSDDKITPETPSAVSLSELFKYATLSDLIIILAATVSSVINGISQPLLYSIFSKIVGLFSIYQLDQKVNVVKAGEDLQIAVNKLCVYFVIIGTVTFIAAYFQVSLWLIVGERQALRIRNKYYQSVLSQEMGWFDQNSSGNVATRLAGNVNLVQEGISDKLGLLIQHLTTFFGGFLIAFTQGWQLTLVLSCVVPLITASGIIFSRILTKVNQNQSAVDSSGSIASEVLSGIRTVYSFNAIKREIDRYTKAIKEVRRVNIKKSLILGLSAGSAMCILYCSYALAMWYGGKLIESGNYQPGDVLTVFLNVLAGSMTLGQTAPSIAALASAKGAAVGLFTVIDRKSGIDPFSCTDEMLNNQEKLKPVKGALEIRNVTFSYPSRPDVAILNNVSFSVPSGATVALVGHSGSGKSTSIGLIERFYEPNEGQILFDGVDVRKLSTKFIRSHIGLVGQEPVLFATTIKNNVLYGLSEEADFNSQELQLRVEEACKKSQIHAFIMSLPNQYDTLVGEKGSQLSGGQKQRIAIARAIIKNPKFLLLDEATSALDTQSERTVQAALDEASKDRTTIIVAHRLSTIMHADIILVFDKGVIVEKGTHHELLDKRGVYAGLVKAQAIRTDSVESQIEDPVFTSEDDQIADIDDKDLITVVVSNVIPDETQLRDLKIKRERLPIIRVLKLSLSKLHLLIFGLIGALVDGTTLPIYSIILTRVTQSFSDIQDPEYREKGLLENTFYSGMFIVLGVVSLLSSLAKTGVLGALGDHITFKIRKTSFACMLRQEMAYYDDPINNVGVLSSRLSTEAEQVQGLISRVLGPFFSLFSCIVFSMYLAFSSGWKLALVSLSSIPLIAIGQVAGISSLTSGSKKTQKAYLKVSQIAMESIVNIRTVSSLALETMFFDDYLSRVQDAHDSAIRGYLGASVGYGISMGISHFTNALMFWYGAKLVASREYDYVQMFQVITSIMFIGFTIGAFSSEMSTFVKSRVAAIEVFDLWDRIPSIDASSEEGLNSKDVKGNISVSNAYFSYPSRPNVPILQGLDLSIFENKKVALVGASGSGKSTIVSLAQRFYDVSSGLVSVENTPIKDWNIKHLRSNMAMVGQEPVLFDLTIGENIAYGSEYPATQEDIESAAKMANAHDFISRLPEGYNTRTGERGSQLSGGQKQRIAIARALIRKPKLLLLDEATSALDSQSEQVVQEALDRASEGRTTITIAHRLRTIQDADLIIVMREGQRVEMGTHNELLKLKGYYYSLINQQSLANPQ